MKKDKRKLWISIMAGILALVMILSLVGMIAPVIAGAEEEKSSSELQEELDALEGRQSEIQAEIDGLQDQLDDNMSEMEKVVTQKSIIDQEIFLLLEQVNTINAQIAAYNTLIADKQAELDEAQKNLTELEEKSRSRIRAMEKESSITYWSVIFEATDFLDLLDRIKMIDEIADADEKMLEDLRLAAEAVSTAKAELETEKAALEENKKELDATQTELEGKRAEADELLNQLVAKGEEYEALVEEAEGRKADLGTLIDEKQAEYDEAVEREEYQAWLEEQARIAAQKAYEEELRRQEELKNQQSGTGSSTGSSGGSVGTSNTTSSGTWVVPISYSAFTSPYGYRWHPVYGDWRFHAGVDLAAPSGTPIVASRSGYVETSSYQAGGAGYYVSIDHGDGYSSIYMHMTHYIVYPGEYVSAGQVIGYCGSTGASTGPHLHFGIYYNGSSVNPADYIAI